MHISGLTTGNFRKQEKMAASRIVYLFTLFSGVKKKDFQHFLVSEWIPALISTPGCLEVELLDTYWDRQDSVFQNCGKAVLLMKKGQESFGETREKIYIKKYFSTPGLKCYGNAQSSKKEGNKKVLYKRSNADMLECPINVHNIYKFNHKNKLYAADIEKFNVFQIDQITWDILDLCTLSSNEEIMEKLSKKYDAGEVTEALEALGQMEKDGLLFHREGKQKPVSEENRKRLKIFVAQKEPFQKDISSVAGGGVIAHHHLLVSLAKYADIYVMDSEEKEISEGIISRVQSFRNAVVE